MRKSALEVIGTIRLTFAGTLLVVGFSFVAPLPGRAVELVDPHAVLEETRRELIELDRRMERYRAERQKEEVRQKREAAEQARSTRRWKRFGANVRSPSRRNEAGKRRSERRNVARRKRPIARSRRRRCARLNGSATPPRSRSEPETWRSGRRNRSRKSPSGRRRKRRRRRLNGNAKRPQNRNARETRNERQKRSAERLVRSSAIRCTARSPTASVVARHVSSRRNRRVSPGAGQGVTRAYACPGYRYRIRCAGETEGLRRSTR